MTKKILKFISLFCLIAIAGFGIMKLTGLWDFFNVEFIYDKFYLKVIDDPANTATITLLLHVTDASHDEFTNIYIIPGKHDKKEIPDINNYLMFPDSTGVYCEWDTNNKLRIYSSRSPINDTFKSDKVTIELIIGRQKIDELEKEGKPVIWNIIEEGD